MSATLKQAKKLLEIFEDTPLEKLQMIVGSGYLTDLRDGDIPRLNRDVFRQWLGLGPIGSKAWSDFLRLISGGESIILAATDGKEILANANDVFAYIDSDFKNWRADELGKPTAETEVVVYEMAKDATFEQMFRSISPDPRDLRWLCLTQAQIKGFVKDKKQRRWLRSDGYGTFFLFESYGHFFVAYVCVFSDGRLVVGADRLEDSDVWSVGHRHRLVVPRLA